MTSRNQEDKKDQTARLFASGKLPGGYLVPGEPEAFEPLSQEEEISLAAVLQNGSQQEKEAAKDRLLLSNIRLLSSVAAKFNNRGLSRSELINEGGVGLLLAAERFKPGHGARFSSYSVWRISQAIRRALARQGRIVRIPLHTLEGLYRMRRLIREFKSNHGTEPDFEQLATLMDSSVAAVMELKRVDSFVLTSIDAVKDADDVPLAEKLPDNNGAIPDEQYGNEEKRELLSEAFKLLTGKEMTVIAMRFGLNGMKVHSLEETAGIFGCTREAVRKIQKKAISKMQRLYDL